MFSSLITATKSRYASFRGDEADGETEDDSHVSRVLRNYYTEQGRPFPPWLGGGPQAQQQQPPTPSTYGQAGGVSLRRGQQQLPPNGGVKATLSDIWDTPSASQQQQQHQHQQGHAATGQQQQPASGMNKMRFFRRDPNPQTSTQSAHESPQLSSGTQHKVNERSWNRSASPGNSTGGYQPPSTSSQQQQGRHGGGGGGGGRYGRRDVSPGYGSRNVSGNTPQALPSGTGGYGASGGGSKPFISAGSPWINDESEFSGGGSGYGGGGGYGGSSNSGAGGGGLGGNGLRRMAPPGKGQKIGLPSGPKMMR